MMFFDKLLSLFIIVREKRLHRNQSIGNSSVTEKALNMNAMQIPMKNKITTKLTMTPGPVISFRTK